VGKPAYPRAEWVGRLLAAAPTGMRLAAHVCSSWAKEICKGQFPGKLDLAGFGRVQLNLEA
jgi:hypothetical protein